LFSLTVSLPPPVTLSVTVDEAQMLVCAMRTMSSAGDVYAFLFMYLYF
jgi:hypothetical protein